MVLSIRKISYENDDLAGAGIWWFKNLNEADPYLILPIIATILNYINLGVSITFTLISSLSVESQKTMSIGSSIVSVPFSKSSNFCIYLSLISGQQGRSSIGSHLPSLCLCSNTF